MKRDEADRGRRRVFKALAGAAFAGAAACAGQAKAYQPGGEEARSRYRETEHVKAFYRTNGYETKKQ